MHTKPSYILPVLFYHLVYSLLCWRIAQAWITEMASYLKSIDRNHLLGAGLEGFYGESAPQKQQFNPNFQIGTDFIANNQIADIDFATVHSYPDQW